MSTAELHLALLRAGPRHGYEVKREHDAWFPDARPLAFGQVYATLARLERDALVEVVETRSDGGPERTIYALTARGEQRLQEWLDEPAPAAGTGTEEIVRKAVAALRTDTDVQGYLSRQRAFHLRTMRDLGAAPPGADPGARLLRDHRLAHLDADLRWLELAAERLRPDRPTPRTSDRERADR